MVKFIAEIGVNHGGNYNKAIELIGAAKESGANIAKFQFYYTDTLCLSRDCFEAYPILEKNKMHHSWLSQMQKECRRKGLEFLCTSFCPISLEEIVPYVSRIKIASPEVYNLKFVQQADSYGKPLILSTGKVTHEQLDNIFDSTDNTITLLYCVTKYPAFPDDYHLEQIAKLKERYDCRVGLSCHCKGIS